MNNKTLNEICKRYNLGKPTQISSLPGGSMHQLWLLVTSQGHFVIKKLAKHLLQGLTEINITQQIAHHYQQHNVPAVAALTHNGNDSIQLAHHDYLVFPYIAGRSITPDELTTKQACQMGQLLATMHLLKLNIPQANTLSPYHLYQHDWQKAFDIATAHNLTITPSQQQLILQLHEHCLAKPATLSIPQVISHRDLTPQNIIWRDENQPFIIDWDYAGWISPTMELLSSALNWSTTRNFTIKKALFSALINSYITQRKLTKEAILSSLPYVYQYWLNWLYFNITRLTDQRAHNECHYTLNSLTMTYCSDLHSML